MLVKVKINKVVYKGRNESCIKSENRFLLFKEIENPYNFLIRTSKLP